MSAPGGCVERAIEPIAAEEPVTREIGFRICNPGQVAARVGLNDIEAGRNLRRRFVLNRNSHRLRTHTEYVASVYSARSGDLIRQDFSRLILAVLIMRLRHRLRFRRRISPDDNAAVPLLKYVPKRRPPTIEHLRMHGAEPTHAVSERQHCRLNHHVVVVGHQAVAQQSPSVPLRRDRQLVEKEPPFGVTVEDHLAAVAALGDVVDRVFDLGSCCSRHAP